jgi:hypothetical protein
MNICIHVYIYMYIYVKFLPTTLVVITSGRTGEGFLVGGKLGLSVGYEEG